MRRHRSLTLAMLAVLLLCFGLALAEKTCPKCGTENTDAAKFCKNCGTKLSEPEPVRPVRPRVDGQVTVSGTVVSITSDPAGASAIVDGRNRGTTPLELTDLAMGRHELTLSRDGYRDYSTTFTISTLTGTVVVSSDPVGADIVVDGQARGKAVEGGLALNRVQYGSHTITARLSGYEDVTKIVEVKTPGPVAVNFRLGWGKGFLSLRSTPDGASVLLENREVGQTPLFSELAPKRYLLTVAKRGFFDWVGYANVQYAETAFIAADLERMKTRSPVFLALGGVALLGTGVAVALGESQYAKYQSASDPERVLHYRNATQQWDIIRDVGAGTTAALAVSFLVFRF
jgi:hypothetical protein